MSTSACYWPTEIKPKFNIIQRFVAWLMKKATYELESRINDKIDLSQAKIQTSIQLSRKNSYSMGQVENVFTFSALSRKQLIKQFGDNHPADLSNMDKLDIVKTLAGIL